MLKQIVILVGFLNLCSAGGSLLISRSERLLPAATLESMKFFQEIDLTKVHVIKSVDEKFERQSNDIIETLLSNSMRRFSFTIRDLNLSCKPASSETKVRLTIVVVDSVRSFERFSAGINASFDHHGYFLIVHLNGNQDDIRSIFKLLWDVYIYNVNIICEIMAGEISMLTFLPFNRKACNDLSPKIINEFDRKSMTWERDFEYPEKFNNLHQCTLKIGLAPMYKFVDDTFDTIKEKLNFTVQVHMASHMGLLSENGSATGMTAMLRKNEICMLVGMMSLQALRLKFFSATISFYNDMIILLIPPPAALTSMAKLIYPFQAHAWAAIVSLFSISFFVIFIINRLPWQVYDFVIGQNIKSPYLNLVNVFVGLSQKSLPNGSFARFLLMMLLIFSLVLRSMYSGKLFRIMSSEVYAREMETIDEFYEAKYDFYMHHGTAGLLKGSKFFNA